MVEFIKTFLPLQNYFHKNNSSNNFSCPLPAEWCFYDYDRHKFCIQYVTLPPLNILALLIGLICSKRISKLPGKFPTRWFYQLAFYLYGIMMTSAGILHCFLSNPQTNENSLAFFQFWFSIIDYSLTTNIAVTFLFCGLCDVRFLNPQSIRTRYLLFTSYFIIVILWICDEVFNWTWPDNLLYNGAIEICCFIYGITQLCIKSNRQALPALFVGGIFAILGFIAESFGEGYLCNLEGPFWSQYFGPEFTWCLFADISMVFIFIYVILANKEEQVIIKKYPIDMKKSPEKF